MNQVMGQERERVPWSVFFVAFTCGAIAMVWGLLFLWEFTVYFSGKLTSHNLLAFLLVHLATAAGMSFMAWMPWALWHRVRTAWYAYVVMVLAGVIWVVVSYLWRDKPLDRTGNLLTAAHAINLLFWFSADVKAWSRIDRASAPTP
jgi:hypothetical protein